LTPATQAKKKSGRLNGCGRYPVANSDLFRLAIVFSWPRAVTAVVISTEGRPLVIPSGGRPLVIPSVRCPFVIPSGAEGSGCEWEVRHVRRQMSRLRFAPLDMTRGTNSLVGRRSARPPAVRMNGATRFRPHPAQSWGPAEMRWWTCRFMMGTSNGQAHDHVYRQPMCRTVPPAAHSLFSRARSRFVIPAEAGIHFAESFAAHGLWIPAPFGCAQGGLRRNDRVSLGILPFRRPVHALVAFSRRPAAP